MVSSDSSEVWRRLSWYLLILFDNDLITAGLFSKAKILLQT
jgi:hypothetical protein